MSEGTSSTAGSTQLPTRVPGAQKVTIKGSDKVVVVRVSADGTSAAESNLTFNRGAPKASSG